MKDKSQLQGILEALQRGETLTPIDALNRFGCFRLGARIWDLRKKGYEIDNIGADDGNYAKYKFKRKAIAMPPAFAPKKPEQQTRLL